MKFVFVLYAIIGIAAQVAIGYLTGLGQGSFGLLIFIFLVEIDPRFSFRYIGRNIKERMDDSPNEGGQA